MSKKNIIFDLNGVLFTKSLQDLVPLEEGIALLQECSSHEFGHRLYVCSNMRAQYLEQLHIDFPDIMSLFMGIVTPATAHVEKPNKEIFQHLLDLYDIKAEESFFLDDHVINIEAVEQLGMTGIHVEDFKRVRLELIKRGIL